MDRHEHKLTKLEETLKVPPFHSRKVLRKEIKKSHGYFTGMSINNDFYIPFTSL